MAAQRRALPPGPVAQDYRFLDAQGNELRLLDLSSNCLVALPDALARCHKLEVVNLTNNPYSYVRSSFGSWDNARLMWDFPEVLTRLPRLRKLSLDQTFVRALPARAFDSEQLEPLTIKRTLITEADAALHPKIAVDVASSYEKAVDYIGYWFDGVEDGLREQLEQCDWSDAQALLALLLRINVPISAPYDKALARFDKEIEKVCRRLRWAPEQAPHLRSLFAALGEAVDVFAAERGENALVAGLRQRFAEQARE